MNYNIVPSQKVNFQFDNTNLDSQWNQIPLYMQPNEIPLAKTVLTLLNDFKTSKPSYLAGLTLQQAKSSHTINLIDNLFAQAIDAYIDDLKIATLADIANNQKVRNASNGPTMAICKGAIRAAQYNFNYPIINLLVGTPLLIVGGIYGWCMQNSMIEEVKNDESSVNRISWLKNVLLKEQLRTEEAVKLILQRANILKIDINKNDTVLYRVDFFEELTLLDTLMNSISAKTPLKIDNLSVGEYLNRKKICQK
jgi:uncharacterized membrane-anchored protein YjiN (DUF445 family)